MTGAVVPGPRLDGLSWRDGLLWASAAVMVVCAHGGGAWLALRSPAVPPPEAAAPAAIMIEFAAVPIAPEAREQEIAAPQDEAASAPDEAAVEPEVTDDLPEAEPIDEVPPDQPPEERPDEATDPIEPNESDADEPSEVDLAETVQEEVDVPLPIARPVPPKPKSQPPDTARPQPRRAATAQAAARPQVMAQPAPLTAAQQSSRGTAPAISPARWQSRLLAHLERHKRYPSSARSRREQGIAYVRFRIDAGGKVTAVSLARSSGFPALDREVVDMVRRASPVPAPPPGVSRSMTVPVRFGLR